MTSISDTPEVTALKLRILAAADLAKNYGQVDGSHHKMWVIDQMVRALLDCPTVEKTKPDCFGVPMTYEVTGTNAEYLEFVKEATEGEDGPDTYSWDIGIAP